MLDGYNEGSLTERRKINMGDLLIAYLPECHGVNFFKVLRRTEHYITVQKLKTKCIAEGRNSKRVFRKNSNSIFWFIPSDEPPFEPPFRSKIYDDPEDSNWDCTFKNGTFTHRYGNICARIYTDDQFKCVVNENNEFTPDWIVSKEEFLREFQETEGKFIDGFTP